MRTIRHYVCIAALALSTVAIPTAFAQTCPAEDPCAGKEGRDFFICLRENGGQIGPWTPVNPGEGGFIPGTKEKCLKEQQILQFTRFPKCVPQNTKLCSTIGPGQKQICEKIEKFCVPSFEVEVVSVCAEKITP